MKLLPEGKSRALSACALGAGAFSGAMGVKAVYDLFTMLGAFGMPTIYMSLAGATVPYGMPPLAVLLTRHVRLVFFFLAVFWCSAAGLAAGVWLRREWGRRGAVWTLYVLAGAALLVLLYPWVMIPKPLYYAGVPIVPEFNSAVKAAAFAHRVMGFLGGGLCLWWALALDRGGLKGEFH